MPNIGLAYSKAQLPSASSSSNERRVDADDGAGLLALVPLNGYDVCDHRCILTTETRSTKVTSTWRLNCRFKAERRGKNGSADAYKSPLADYGVAASHHSRIP